VSYVHIVTVGASLASNYEMERTKSRVSEASIEEKLSRVPEAERNIYSKSLLNHIKEKERDGRLPESCAELHALSGHLGELSIAYLLHTDTNLGKCCSKAIQEYLRSRGVQAPQPIEIQGLHGPQTFQRGLANLVRETAKILAQHGNARVCATGGFKPEVALASILGFIAKAPVYYIHESFREEIHLPSLPVKWTLDVKRYGKAIDTVIAAGEEGVEKTRLVEDLGKETVQMLLGNWLIEERDGRYAATEVSRAILEAMRLLAKR
jgi:putative CRISPR-associated protein (TIGR02619 family)